MNNKFIKTQDSDVAEKLVAMGFKQIPSTMGEYIFINTNSIKLNFSDSEMKKVYFTNILSL